MASLTGYRSTRATQPPFAASQFAILIGYGAALWFGAALLTRAIGPLGAFDGGAMMLVLYALVVPGTVPFVLLMRKLARLRGDQTALGITVVTATALLLDGKAFALIPSLYDADTLGAAATILWGAGVGLALGIVMNEPDRV